MNSKKAKAIRRRAKQAASTTEGMDETTQYGHRRNTPGTAMVDPYCSKGIYRAMKKTIKDLKGSI